MNQAERYDQIERYLANKMAAQERSIFEKKLNTDKELRAELNLHNELGEVVKGEGFHKLRAVLKNTDAHWQAPNSTPSAKIIQHSFWKKIALVAAVAVLGLFLWQLLPYNTPDELFATHFEPYPMVLTQRSAPTDATGMLNNAITAYAEKDFAKAAAAFQELLTTNPNQPIYQLYSCVSELGLGQNDIAIPCFKNLQNIPNLQEQATWYLALSFLQKEDVASAKLAFESIQQGQYKFSESQSLLSQL